MIVEIELCSSPCYFRTSSVGTYGFWGSYLAGGDTILAAGNSKIPHELVEMLEDYPISNWQFQEDPCQEKGRLKKKCLEHRRDYGVTL